MGCARPKSSNEFVQEKTRSDFHPAWSKNMGMYEVNLRQYTPEGTIAAFTRELENVSQLGVEVIWLMPIFPIGEKNRKGSLGSAYSVKDYTMVNPDLGTLQDLKDLVKKAHNLGMKVLLDWVANHSAWDNELTLEHPDWYIRDKNGNFLPPKGTDWSDVIAFDYSNAGLRRYMTDALRFWVQEADIDGFRCDMASLVPTDFWEKARIELDKIKPVFMLAEAEESTLLEHAFDLEYGWKLLHMMEDVAKGKKPVSDLKSYAPVLAEEAINKGRYKMLFTTNHDENAWNGTVFERFGEGAKAFAALTFTLPGVPMIYGGQEAGLSKALSFFDKDTIQWRESDFRPFYSTLLHLNKENQALWNGLSGSKIEFFKNTSDQVFAFQRRRKNDTVVAIFNLSEQPAQFVFAEDIGFTTLKDVLANQNQKVIQGSSLRLGPWEFYLLTN